MKIWQKYFTKEFLKVFFLFIFCFYGLYILIDYSSRSATQYAGKFSFLEIAEMYLFVFIQRMDILIPFALVVAAVKTYSSLNIRNELVALMSSGVRLKTLAAPFAAIGLAGVALLYINEEFFIPHAYARINFLKDAHSDDNTMREQERNIQSLEVEGEGRLIFHAYNTARSSFFDVYWLKSPHEIYRIKYLYPEENTVIGKFVDKFTRTEEGELLLAESLEEKEFPGMKFDPSDLRQSIIDPRQEPISELVWRYRPFRSNLSDFQARAQTSLYHKLAIPWLCYLAAIGPLPFCFRFTRQLPVFFIYLVSMMAMVTFYLVMNSALIIGENQVFSPFTAILIPFGLYFYFIYSKYRSFVE